MRYVSEADAVASGVAFHPLKCADVSDELPPWVADYDALQELLMLDDLVCRLWAMPDCQLPGTIGGAA